MFSHTPPLQITCVGLIVLGLFVLYTRRVHEKDVEEVKDRYPEGTYVYLYTYYVFKVELVDSLHIILKFVGITSQTANSGWYVIGQITHFNVRRFLEMNVPAVPISPGEEMLLKLPGTIDTEYTVEGIVGQSGDMHAVVQLRSNTYSAVRRYMQLNTFLTVRQRADYAETSSANNCK